MNINRKIINFLKSYFGCFLFFLFFIILFRDFLYTYRIQIEKFLPYYQYHEQIMFYITGDYKYDVEAPMNLRFLGLWIQFLIYKFLPCIELSSVRIVSPYPEYPCVIYSNAMMNYLSLCGILSLTFSYCYKKLNLNLSESILTVFLTYIYLNHVEAFTLDRISIFYFLIVLYFLDKRNFSIILILFASIVNEKIVYILGILFFIRLFLNQKKEYKSFFIATFFSGLCVIAIFYLYSVVLGHGYHMSDLNGEGIYDTAISQGAVRVFGIFMSKSGLSNGAVPLILSLIPYILAIFIKERKFYFSKVDILIPISLLVFTTGGGMEQTGRYVMYSLPLWLPIFSQQILFFLKKQKNNV